MLIYITQKITLLQPSEVWLLLSKIFNEDKNIRTVRGLCSGNCKVSSVSNEKIITYGKLGKDCGGAVIAHLKALV
jgi:hypothetical protein